MKKKVFITFETEAETDLEAVFSLNKVFRQLSDKDLEKFDVLSVSQGERA